MMKAIKIRSVCNMEQWFEKACAYIQAHRQEMVADLPDAV